MKLTGELKEKVEKAESKEEAKKAIEEAGVSLDDQLLDQVTGGMNSIRGRDHQNNSNRPRPWDKL
jgi:hypothetical protein